MARSTRAGGIRALCGALLTLAVASAPSPLAFAASSSPRPIADVHSLGPIALWDKAGHQLTGGSTRLPLDQEIGRASASGPAPVGFRDAFELDMWTPRDGADPSQWAGGPLRAGNTDRIAKDRQTASLSTTNISNWTLTQDITLCSGPSTGSYQNLYQLRLMGIKDGPELSTTYYTATIVVDPAAGTWSLVESGAPSSSGLSLVPVGGAIGAAALVAALGAGLHRRRRRSSAARVASLLQTEPTLR